MPSSSVSTRVWLAGAVVGLGMTPAARAVIVGVPDTFSDGTVSEWFGGTTITNVTNGQGGAGDRFITVQTLTGSSSGSHLATHNADPRWTGDYIAANIASVTVDMRNQGTTTLQMRVVLFGLGNRWTSTNAITLAPSSGWQHLTFPVSQSSLTRVLGSATYQDCISAVTQIMFRHDTSTPSSGGETVNGILGIDNVTAVPAPGAVCVLGLAGVLGLRRRR